MTAKKKPAPFSAVAWIKGAEAAGVPCRVIRYPTTGRGFSQCYVDAKMPAADRYAFGRLTEKQLKAVADELERQGKVFVSTLESPTRKGGR